MAELALCTKDQVKARIGIKDTKSDERIDELIGQAQKTIAKRYGREFLVPSASAIKRLFVVRNQVVDLCPFELRSVTAVTLNPEATTPSVLVAGQDYVLTPINKDPSTATYLGIRLNVDYSASDYYANFGFSQLQIEGMWGAWSDVVNVAEDVNMAVIETVLSWLNRPASQVAQEVLGEARANQPAIPSTWDIPAAAHRKLVPYSRELGVY